MRAFAYTWPSYALKYAKLISLLLFGSFLTILFWLLFSLNSLHGKDTLNRRKSGRHIKNNICVHLNIGLVWRMLQTSQVIYRQFVRFRFVEKPKVISRKPQHSRSLLITELAPQEIEGKWIILNKLRFVYWKILNFTCVVTISQLCWWQSRESQRVRESTRASCCLVSIKPFPIWIDSFCASFLIVLVANNGPRSVEMDNW